MVGNSDAKEAGTHACKTGLAFCVVLGLAEFFILLRLGEGLALRLGELSLQTTRRRISNREPCDELLSLKAKRTFGCSGRASSSSESGRI
jgi:hypothetical protein